MPSRGAIRLALLLASSLALALSARPAVAKAQPACKKALDEFDASMGDRTDNAAMAATRKLEEVCAKPDADRALAVSRRAMVHFGRHEIGAAVAAFEEAVQLGPENATLRQSLCGVYTEAGRYRDAITSCEAGLELAKAQDDGSEDKHDLVLRVGFNLALAKVKQRPNQCHDHTVYEAFEAYRAAHPDHAWVHQMLGAWAWDCDDDFERGFALYKKSCTLGQESACEQVRYTEQCRCQDRLGG